MNRLHTLKSWVKNDPSFLAKTLRSLHQARHRFEVPDFMVPLYHPLRPIHHILQSFLSNLIRIFYWTPLFKTRLSQPTKQLFLYGGMPLVLGPLKINCGSDCRLSGQTTFAGRSASQETPELIIGNNVDIGWQTTICVAEHVILGNNVRIAGRCFIAGYPGHPLNAQDRARGLPETQDQIGSIIIDDDVWIATGVSIMTGVHIGAETIVAAGSVVTKDLPCGVLAGGNPARVIRKLSSPQQEAAQ